ncbi:hypothetical protein [Paenibacillus durus]|uniref:Uncharacterized protein n=1 Tax=Paenibacillus durus ATCC 35681 TaxID=1333534 RepID=A0A0F7CID6_PAEDU|nr:hypothetical protein [Paenibacillus durus]AKG35256.1 hypothetical protein VK70_12275 [Paenibacillus durus ATCC 35681]
MIDAEYDDKGFCWVTNAELKDLLKQNGLEPVESGDSSNNNFMYWKYQTKLSSEQLKGDFDSKLRQQLVEVYNKLNKIISHWQDEQRNNKYRLDRWQLK